MAQPRQSLALLIIRMAVAGNMLIHGVYRLIAGGVAPFDGFLTAIGFPPYTAWINLL